MSNSISYVGRPSAACTTRVIRPVSPLGRTRTRVPTAGSICITILLASVASLIRHGLCQATSVVPGLLRLLPEPCRGKVGVGAQLLVLPPTQQGVGRLIGRL